MANFVDGFLWRDQEISFLVKNAFLKEESNLVTTAQEIVCAALGSQLLLFLGRKFCAAVDRDVHLGHDLTNPLLHGHTLVCRKESFQHQESILLEQELSRRPWTSGFGSASGAEMASREEALIVQTLRWEAELPNRRLPWGA